MFVFILKYIFIALCLAYMNHVFSKKKAVMYDVKRHILEKRLEIYASLHKLFLRNSTLIAPPAIKEQYYWSLMNGMPFRIGDQKMEYVSYFDTYKKLYGYYLFLQRSQSKSVFLPRNINDSLELICEWYKKVIEILTAFKMVEDEESSLNERQKEEHLDLACKMFGIALQYDIDYVSTYQKHLFSVRLQMPSLLNLFKSSVMSKIRLWYFERNFEKLDLCKYPSYLIVLLMYIHVSDKYFRDEFDELPPDKRDIIMKDFHSQLIKYLPHD